MLRSVIIDGVKHAIDQQNVLGSGGEATVVKSGDLAVKLYHQVDSRRIEKIRAFTQLTHALPDNVCVPLHLAYDVRKNIVGFAMRAFPVGYEVVQMLSSKKFRLSHPQFNSRFIADLFLHDYKTIELLHSENVIVGDNNDLNTMFHLTQPKCVFIDVDSFQIAPHPCMVGTETYLDPQLYNLDLSKQCYFKPEHDWYSFWAMFIKSLIMVHPYGGVHPDHRNLPQRALHRITFFDQLVKYPKAGLSLQLLDDNLSRIVERIFSQGERFKPPMDMIQQYRDGLVECKSCGVCYPHIRRTCPQCATTNTQVIPKKTQTYALGKQTADSELIFSTKGVFVWVKQHHQNIFAVAREDNCFYFYSSSGKFKLFSSTGSAPKFDMFAGRYVVVNREPGSPKIYILDTAANFAEVAIRPCDLFHGRAVFSCSQDHLFRVYNGSIYRGETHSALSFIEDAIFNVIKDQTSFVASPHASVIFGYQRFFNNRMFFLLKTGNKSVIQHHQLDLQLPVDESILDMSTKFDLTTILLLLKTEIKGRTYTRIYVIKIDDGTIISEYKVEAISSDTYRNIHGKAFARPMQTNGIVLHPTDAGIVQEMIGHNCVDKQTLLTATEPFIGDGDYLIHHRQGLLTVSNNEIRYLTLNNSPFPKNLKT